jgi:hypothetical protein
MSGRMREIGHLSRAAFPDFRTSDEGVFFATTSRIRAHVKLEHYETVLPEYMLEDGAQLSLPALYNCAHLPFRLRNTMSK